MVSLQVIKQILLADPEGQVLVLDTRASFPIPRLQSMLEEEPWMDQERCTYIIKKRPFELCTFSNAVSASGAGGHYAWLDGAVLYDGEADD